jgi:uncharacterized protein (DUF1697 family)
MAAYAALLRAVNVGGRHAVAMAALRELFEDLGYTDVATYVQSGNVVFRAPGGGGARLERAIEAGIAERFGFDVTTIVRSHADLVAITRANPYAKLDDDPTHLLVMFLAAAPKTAAVRALDGSVHAPDVFTVDKREIYLHCPNGFGRSKLTNDFFERKLGVRSTARNWRTLDKLVELTSA